MKNTFLVAFMLLCTIAGAQTFIRSELPTPLSTPWEIQYGPDGFLWISESGGRISRVDPLNGNKTVVYTAADYYGGSPLEQSPLCFQPNIGSGTHGLALDPDFGISNPTYLYLVHSYNHGDTITPYTRFKIARITWDPAIQQVIGDTTIVDSLANGFDHFGGRLLAVKRNGQNYLFYSAGDNGISETNGPTCYNPQTNNPNNFVQDPFALNGKIHRFNMDGSIPFDNPIPGNSFYTRGHRNPQGLAYNPQEDLLYDIEHGDRTDDEINVLYAGMNYGWKTVRGYHGDNNIPGEDSIIANYTPHPLIANDSLVPALFSWCDTIPPTLLSPPTWCTVAPSDGLFYKSNIIPEFNNSLLVVTLKDGNVTDQQMYCVRLNPDGKSVAPSTLQQPNPTTYFGADQLLNGRLRDIAISPDSTTIYLVNNGGANADKITVYTLLNAALNNGVNLANAITLLPNPTIDDLTIRTDLNWTSAELIDINGRICRSIPSSEKKISTLELESGVYFLRFILDQHGTINKKFIKL